MFCETPQLKKKKATKKLFTHCPLPPRYFLKQLGLSLPDMAVKAVLHSFGAGEIKGLKEFGGVSQNPVKGRSH